MNAEDFCSREDKICYNKRYEGGKRREKEQRNATLLKLASCGEEGACVTGFVSPSETYPIQMCLCNAGWRGTFCNIGTFALLIIMTFKISILLFIIVNLFITSEAPCVLSDG